MTGAPSVVRQAATGSPNDDICLLLRSPILTSVLSNAVRP